jgi:hypothetical protein
MDGDFSDESLDEESLSDSDIDDSEDEAVGDPASSDDESSDGDGALDGDGGGIVGGVAGKHIAPFPHGNACYHFVNDGHIKKKYEDLSLWNPTPDTTTPDTFLTLPLVFIDGG